MIQETSLKAFKEEVEPTLGHRHKEVLGALTGSTMTNSELSQRLGWSINRVTPRIFELREKKLVEEAEKRKCSQTGRMAIAWRRITKKQQGVLL